MQRRDDDVFNRSRASYGADYYRRDDRSRSPPPQNVMQGGYHRRDLTSHAPPPRLPPPIPQYRSCGGGSSSVAATSSAVGIFWDTEGVHAHKKSAGKYCLEAWHVASYMRDAAKELGEVISIRLYYDSKKCQHGVDENGYMKSGATLVDCPPRRREKEMVDMVLTVDMMAFAARQIALGRPCTVVLIAADGDFGHALRTLAELGVHTVVWHGQGATTSDDLLAACHQYRDFRSMLEDKHREMTKDEEVPAPIRVEKGVKADKRLLICPFLAGGTCRGGHSCKFKHEGDEASWKQITCKVGRAGPGTGRLCIAKGACVYYHPPRDLNNGVRVAEGQAAWPDELEEEVCQEVRQDVGLKQEV